MGYLKDGAVSASVGMDRLCSDGTEEGMKADKVMIRKLEVKDGKYLVMGRVDSVIPVGTGAVGGYLLISDVLYTYGKYVRPGHLTILQTTSLFDDNHFIGSHLHPPKNQTVTLLDRA